MIIKTKTHGYHKLWGTLPAQIIRFIKSDCYLTTKGNIFALLFAATGLIGVLGVVSMQTVMGPATTVTKVTQKNIVDSDLLTNARIVVMHAGTLANNGDLDSDNYVEPAPFRSSSCDKAPNGGGCLPTDIGAILTDPWGTDYGYCVWDHGPNGKNNSSNRLQGKNDTSHPVIAIISAGPDKNFQTQCEAFDGSAPEGLVQASSSDDLVRIYTYDAAVAGSGGLWTIKENDANTAIINKRLEVGDIDGGRGFSLDTSTGEGVFPYIKTDYLASKAGGGAPVTMDTNLALDGRWINGDGDNEGLSISSSGQIRLFQASSSYDIWIQGGELGTSGNARNLALLGVASSDYLSINHNSEYVNGTRVGGPVTIYGDTTITGDIHSSGNKIRDANGGWIRTYNNTGWYNGTYGGGWYMTDSSWIRAYANKSVHTGGNMRAGAFLYNSDIRLKENITPFHTDLNKLANVKTYRYNYRTDKRKEPHIGVMAQEIQKIYPELVKEDENGYLSVDYPALVPVLLDAINSLNERLNRIEQKTKSNTPNH